MKKIGDKVWYIHCKTFGADEIKNGTIESIQEYSIIPNQYVIEGIGCQDYRNIFPTQAEAQAEIERREKI